MYGKTDEALDLLERMFATFGMATPGSMSEMSPDYGCFVQAWTAYATFLPVVRFFFGIEPVASEEKIYVAPCLPDRWKKAALKNVLVLDGAISVCVEIKGQDVEITVENNTSYPVELRPGAKHICDGGILETCAPGECVTVKYGHASGFAPTV